MPLNLSGTFWVVLLHSYSFLTRFFFLCMINVWTLLPGRRYKEAEFLNLILSSRLDTVNAGKMPALVHSD